MKTRVTLILAGLLAIGTTVHAATAHGAEACFLCSLCPFC